MPIEESNQQGKRGLGFAVKRISRNEWNGRLESDPVQAFENPVWLTNENNQVPHFERTHAMEKNRPGSIQIYIYIYIYNIYTTTDIHNVQIFTFINV